MARHGESSTEDPSRVVLRDARDCLQLSLAKIRSRRQEQLILVLGINLGTDSRLRKVHALSCEAVPRRSQRTWQIYFSRRSNSPTLRDVQRISSGCQIVTMMKTSEPWHRCNLATDTGILSCLTPAGRSLRQREMRSVFMVITNVFADQAFQMPFVENNHVVQAGPFGNCQPNALQHRSATDFGSWFVLAGCRSSSRCRLLLH